MELLAFVAGVLLTAVASWLICRAHVLAVRAQFQAAAEAQATLTAEREQNLEARASDWETRHAGLHSQLAEFTARYEQGQAKTNALEVRIAQAELELTKERELGAERLGLLEDAQAKFRDAFSALSQEALAKNSGQFLQLAQLTLEKFQESAKGDLEKRQSAIGDLVGPVKEALASVGQKLHEVERVRIDAYRGVTEQVKHLLETQRDLRTETQNLVQALRKPQVRGRWGELQLRRVVEMAGMLDHCDFQEQWSSSSVEGQLRPDMIVHLPNRRYVLIDAKAPLDAFLDAASATDDDTRKAKLKDHSRRVRTHIAELGKKSYQDQLAESPEFVVLFLPNEAYFSAALEYEPELIEYGVDFNVIVATPTTLIALLRAVAYGWRQERLEENAKEISELGRELYTRLSDCASHFARMGKSLAAATDAYNKGVGSLERRVLVTARKFGGLDVAASGKELEELPLLDAIPRELEALELQTGRGKK